MVVSSDDITFKQGSLFLFRWMWCCSCLFNRFCVPAIVKENDIIPKLASVLSEIGNNYLNSTTSYIITTFNKIRKP